MTRPAPSLSTPIEIAKWWRNRGGEAIVVRLTNWENRIFIDVRNWVTVAGKLVPSKKGIAVGIRHLARLKAAIIKAEQQAHKLHLLPADDRADQ